VAHNKIPDPMARRHLLEKSMDAKQALALADAYLAEDRPWEAIAFLVKAGDSERLEDIAKQAIEAGDAFLLKGVLEAQGAEVHDPELWIRLARAAEGAGKTLYGIRARRMADPLEKG
jgi:hypothetical protein